MPRECRLVGRGSRARAPWELLRLHTGSPRRAHASLHTHALVDFLFYGHTHAAEEHRTGPTRVINPGALHRARPKTFVILDLESRQIESVAVE